MSAHRFIGLGASFLALGSCVWLTLKICNAIEARFYGSPPKWLVLVMLAMLAGSVYFSVWVSEMLLPEDYAN